MGCEKKLDLKPNTGIVLPKTLKEFESILDNTEVINLSPALPQISADEYFIPGLQDWQSLYAATARNAAIWQKDIYSGESNITDWNQPYSAIFYANNVLEQLSKAAIENDQEKSRIKGWALFVRAYNFYALVSVFAKGYDPASAGTDPGIPLKLTAGIDELIPRASLQRSYAQITKDALEASELLNPHIIADKRNRPSKVAAFALLARVYLSMRDYQQAEKYADQALALYSTLTDFNTLKTNTSSAFTYNSEETIYFSQLNNNYAELTLRSSLAYGISPQLLELYDPNDLRLLIYFRKNTIGNYNIKSINSRSSFPFTGLATDELYLIKAECLARRNQQEAALIYLNQLLQSRMKTGSFVSVTATDSDDVLNKILTERRKALVWRSQRWTDLKRLNLEGRNITLTRNLGDQVHILEPRSPRYVLPIPDDEIALSGIEQNLR